MRRESTFFPGECVFMNGSKEAAMLLSKAPLNLNFEGTTVRVLGSLDKPQWVAQDVCDVLGIANARMAIADFDDDQKGVSSIYTLGGTGKVATVYESGLYRLIFRSIKPEAKRFQKWVLGEVLPSIRKYGIYPPPQHSSYSITLKPYTSSCCVANAGQTMPAGRLLVRLHRGGGGAFDSHGAHFRSSKSRNAPI